MTKVLNAKQASRGRKEFRKAAVVLLVVAAVFGGLSLVVLKLLRQERDWYAIFDQVVDIETRLRAGDASVSRLFASNRGSGGLDGRSAETLVEQDMRRLASVVNLRFQDVHVDVRGDTALATYRLEGGPSPGPPLSGGRFAFRHVGDAWKPEGHTVVTVAGNAVSDGSGEEWRSAAKAHRHTQSHERLAIRLAAIAVLTLSASLGCAVWWWLEPRLVSRRWKTASSPEKRFR